MKTTVINLFAGPGAGKSTLAAALFSEMKVRGLNVELAREYVKGWAWEGKVPNHFDQFYILGKQVREESKLYGKVDYIISDSPFLLVGLYETLNFGTYYTLNSAKGVIEIGAKHGIKHENFLLSRFKKYVSAGRYQTADEAKQIDFELKYYLDMNKVRYTQIPTNNKKKVEFILKHLEVKNAKRI